jgi:predicted RNase H-like nuclease (RuvC/YqgF family)
LDLKREVESRAFVVKRLEAALHEQAKEFKMLRCKLSDQKKMLDVLKGNGMYAFCVRM